MGTAQEDPAWGCRDAGRVPATALTSGQNTELWASAGPRLAVRREHAIDAMDAGALRSSRREVVVSFLLASGLLMRCRPARLGRVALKAVSRRTTQVAAEHSVRLGA